MNNEVRDCTNASMAKQMLEKAQQNAKEWGNRLAELSQPRTGDVGFSEDRKLWFVVVVANKFVTCYYQPNFDGIGSSVSSAVPINSPDTVKIKESIVYNLFDRFGCAITGSNRGINQ